MSEAAEGSDVPKEPAGQDRLIRPALVLTVILCVAAVVRLLNLGSLPPALFRDEAEKALNGWFLLQGGVDAQGRPWPIFIEVFGVTTSAIYQYATLPFLALGGLNEWSARLPAATVGILTVHFTWMFCRKIWGWQAAAWAAGLLAISPWHVPLSRWAQQGVFLPFLFIVAAWAVARYIGCEAGVGDGRRNPIDGGGGASDADQGGAGSPAWLMLAGACMAVAMYAYDPARLFAPLLALAAMVIWWRVWVARWQAVLGAFAVFLLAASPVIWLLATQSEAAQARFRFLSVFQPGGEIGDGVAAFVGNYFAHFSPAFLLITGDEELRHSGGVGMLNLAELVLAIVGVVFALRHRSRWGVFVLCWILLSPVAASLTRVGVPHALRSQVALPAWQIMAAVGIIGLAGWVKDGRQKATHQVALLVALLGSLPFFLSYFGSYSARSAANWQYGVKQVVEYVSAPHTRDSTVYFKYVTGAEYLVPFYAKMDRSEYQRMLQGRTRFHVVPFGLPGLTPAQTTPWLGATGPAILASPPGLEWPDGWIPVPINSPGGEQMAPVMIMYLNETFMDKMKEHLKQ